MDTEFLESNLIRAFPFIANYDQKIPDWLIADVRIEVRSGNWDPSRHRMFLAWVTRFGSRVRFGIRTDAPDLKDQELVFERDLDDPRFETQFVESTDLLDTVEDRCGCGDELLCNTIFRTEDTCEEMVCNGGFFAECGPEHICNPEFEPNAPFTHLSYPQSRDPSGGDKSVPRGSV